MSEYTLHHGDCLDILPTLEPQSVDAVICDPPYGTTACKWDSVIPFEPMWAGIRRVLKPRGACVLFGSQPFTSALVMSNVEMFKYTWVWEKDTPTGHLDANRRPMKAHEDLVVFASGNVTFNPQKWRGRPNHGRTAADGAFTNIYSGAYKTTAPDQSGMKYPRSVIKFPKYAPCEVLHPTQKPIALLEYLVKTYTNEGDVVLDFAMGSGTTGAACGNLDRRFIGIEKDAGYFAIASERIATAYAPLRMMQEAV